MLLHEARCLPVKDTLKKVAAVVKAFLLADNPSFLEEALVLRGTFHVLTGNSKAALSDFNEIINIKDADIKVS